MRPILYFHAQKFSIPSSLSSSLVLEAILSENHKKLKFCGMRKWPYQEMRLNEVSWLVSLDSRDFNSSPSKSDLQDSASAVFWYSYQTKVWLFRRLTHPKIVIPSSKDALWKGATFHAINFMKLKIFPETLIYSGERERAILPCEGYPI